MDFNRCFGALLLVTALIFTGGVVLPALAQDKIVHDAEYYILEAQNGERWAAEDQGARPKAGGTS